MGNQLVNLSLAAAVEFTLFVIYKAGRETGVPDEKHKSLTNFIT
jgi:hypothetical protein